MKYGICNLSVIPVRKEPKERSEMTTQLLFGEVFHILTTDNTWLHISSEWDDYAGWIDEKQCEEISHREFQAISNNQKSIALDLAKSATQDNNYMPLLIGATLPSYDGLNFYINKKKYVYNGQVVNPYQNGDTQYLLTKVAYKFMNAPYLWGGKNIFGIDCSGFTQLVFKILGIRIQRDAYQQAAQGKQVNLIDEAETGDLAFFTNKKGNISHVGIILPEGRIIHAAGQVRIDKLDQQGIFNEDKGKYTHELRLIRRMF